MSTAAERMQRLRDRLAQSKGRSPMARWMRRNHAEFAAILIEQPVVDWTAVAAHLAEDEHLTDRDGKPPTARAVRAAWARVTTQLERERARTEPQVALPQVALPQVAVPAGQAPASAVAPVRPSQRVALLEAAADPDAGSAPRHRFRTLGAARNPE